MADLFQSKRLQTAIWASKMLLLTVGMVSTLTLLKVAVIPYLVNLTLSTVPDLWISIRSCLSPLYMYIIINFIIITLAASSTFQHHPNQKQFLSTMTKKQFQTQSDKIQHGSEKNRSQLDDQINWHSFQFHISEEEQIQKPNSTEPPNSIISPPDVVDISFNDDQLPETHSSQNPVKDSGESPAEKPKEDENDDDDTLDGTWKAIMEGQGKAKARQLKKSDTWDVPPRVAAATKLEVENDLADWARRELKSETFSDRVTMRMRDKSMSQEELYERAEDFIKKFNLDMRLQRQESDQRFMEMVNRGL